MWQERAKQIDIWTERGREVGSSILQHKKRRESEESKNKDKKVVVIKLKILNKKGKIK
jgi:hypothetical protein